MDFLLAGFKEIASDPKMIVMWIIGGLLIFLAIKKDVTDDWCFTVKNGVIVEEKVGGIDTWQMVGISYWNEKDGEKLESDIKTAYEMPGGKEKYWEQVPLDVFKSNYKVAIRECKDEDIIEIDTFKELKQIDKTYDV